MHYKFPRCNLKHKEVYNKILMKFKTLSRLRIDLNIQPSCFLLVQQGK